ncbi:MAG TPA: hypothetical protein VM425_04710 [Myxococcota bacterium]|nr:hypothetical protein [Myxococcota bacterium]
MEMKSFISVTPDVLESLDQIFETGARGTHLLFSNAMIRKAFSRKQSVELLADSNVSEHVQQALTDLLDVDNLDERQEVIEALDPDTRDVLVHIYFGFLDKYVFGESVNEASPEVLH